MERDVEEIIRDVENSLTKRQRAVFEIVKNAKVDVNVRYIAKKLNLSEYTIRNFTRTLTKLGYLKESYVGKAGIMKMYSLPSDDEIKKIKKKVRKKYDTFNFPEIKTG